MLTREERIAGGIYGLLIGDALGVPYEFHPPQQLPPREQIEFEPPAGFQRAHSGIAPGTWSDDGAHALCFLASLLYQKRLDPEDLGRRLWARRTLQGAADPWAEAVSTFRKHYPEGHDAHAEQEFHIRPDRTDPGRGSGYVVDCLISARDCVLTEDTIDTTSLKHFTRVPAWRVGRLNPRLSERKRAPGGGLRRRGSGC